MFNQALSDLEAGLSIDVVNSARTGKSHQREREKAEPRE
jgi:hypothetical protein